MKIALIGYGKMGKLCQEIALKRNHQVITIDPLNADHSEINAQSLAEVDVCIDFSSPKVVLENIRKVAELNKNLVVGTTGWYDHLEEVKEITKNIGFLYASNFSVGMNLFFQMTKDAAKLMNKFNDFDVAGVELHHNQKLDSPSGTTTTLANILKDNLDRKEKLVYDIVDRKIEPNELHFASLRCGSIPGTHSIFFDSTADTIELKHTARNREGFASGAVLAAEWLNGKQGFFTFSDIIKEERQ